MKKQWLWFFALLLSSALVFGSASTVLAQDDSEDLQTIMLDEIVVTGSRIPSEEGFGQISPVSVIGMDEINALGLTRIEDVLNAMPQLEAGQTAFYVNGSTGTATLDLRGLSPERTLVLINGRRMQPGGTNTQNVDVNQIPAAMIERVEVLTGGASATYGSDAVAGVVNFIMRKIDGVEISLGASGYQHDNDNNYIQGLMDAKNFSYPTGSSGIDGKAWNIDVVAGSEFAGGKGHATLYGTWRKNDELRQEARDYSSCALNGAATVCGGSANAIVPNFDIYPLVPDVATGGADYSVAANFWATLAPDGSLIPSPSSNRYNYAPVNHFMRPDERWSTGAFIDLEVNKYATVYMELQYANDYSRSQIAESGTFFAEEYYLPLTSAYFPAAFQTSLTAFYNAGYPGQNWFAMYIGKRNVEGGARVEITDHSAFRVVGGVKGEITDDWSYDVSYLKGRTTSSSTYQNDFFADSIRTAITPALCAADSDCIPYQVFTYNGVTPAAAAGLTGTAISANETSLQMIMAQVTGNLGVGLPAGDIMVAGGYEYREEDFEDIRDYVYEEGLLLGQGGPRPSLEGSFTVTELFGEAKIPLLKDMPAAQNVILDLALRWSDHNIAGSDSTYRAGLDWQVIDQLRVRTGYNRAVRAPNIEELFESQFINLWSGVDPCSGAAPTYTAAQCANTGVTALQYGNISASPAGQYNLLRGGNPGLAAEEADTITFGVVVDPIDNLTISLDYWEIKVDGTIGTIGASLIVDLCATGGQFCDLVIRNPAGSLWLGQTGWVEDTQQNIGEEHHQGLDIAGVYSLDALGGVWKFNLLGTYLIKKETTPLANDPSTTYDCVGLVTDAAGGCFPSPEWRHTASVTYDSRGTWQVTTRWRHFGQVDYEGTTDTLAMDGLDAMNYIDLNARVTFLDNYEIMIGVNNVFDKEPPMMGNTIATNANTIAGFYDTLGRFLFSKVTLRF